MLRLPVSPGSLDQVQGEDTVAGGEGVPKRSGPSGLTHAAKGPALNALHALAHEVEATDVEAGSGDVEGVDGVDVGKLLEDVG